MFTREIKRLLSISFPMYIAMVCLSGMGLVGAMIAGQQNTDDLTVVSLSNLMYFTFYLTLASMMMAINPMMSELLGSGKVKEVSQLCRQGLLFSLALSILGIVAWLLLTYPLITYLEYEHYNFYIQKTARYYLLIMAFAFPPALLQRTLQAYLISINNTKPIMITSFACFILFSPLAYFLTVGGAGFEGLGALGCGIALCIIFWFMLVLLGILILKNEFFKQFELLYHWTKPDVAIFKEIFQLGLPIAIAFLLEIGVFLTMVFLIVPFGKLYVAAQEVVAQVSNILYMLPQSIGLAASVRISYSVGRRELMRARYIAGVSLCMAILSSLLTASFLILFNQTITQLFSNDIAVTSLVHPVLIIVAFFQLSDAIQITTAGALRGYKITKFPMYINFIAYWVIGFGLGYYLAIILDYRLKGFWTALAIGLTFCAICLIYCLQVVSKNLIEGDNHA